MFHTTDEGRTWNKVSLPCAPTAFFRVHRLPGNLDTLVAATDCGLLRSTSGPNGPWTIVLSGLISDLVLHPGNANIQFCAKQTTGATLDGGIYRSGDGGQTWSLILTTDTPFENFGLARIAICRDQPNTMAFVYERGRATQGVRKSTDGGLNWTDITPVPANPAHWPLFEAQHCMAIAIRPNNPDQIFVGANNAFRTLDGGQAWQIWEGPVFRHQDQTQFYFSFATGDDVMWWCNDGGIFRYYPNSHTSESWNGTAAGNLSISTVADMDARGAVRAAGFQDDGVAGSGDSGVNWTGYSCCDVYKLAVTEVSPPTFWFKDQPGGPIKKQVIGGGEQNVSDPNVMANQLRFDPFSNKILSLTTDLNGFNSVISRHSSATTPGPWTREVMNLPVGTDGIAVSPLNGNTLYLWQNQPQNGVVTVLTKSGPTWNVTRTATIGGLIDGSMYQVTPVTASPDRAGEAWAGLVTRFGVQQLGGTPLVVHTTDGWQTSNRLSRLPSQAGQVTDIAVTPANTRQIFAATDVGVFCTEDGGATWQSFQTGLPQSVYCNVLRYVEATSTSDHDKLVLATYGRGVYERLLPRRKVTYVDQRNTGAENGSRIHPFNTIVEGINATPASGTMALNGATIYQAPPILDKPMTITAYEFPAKLTR